LTEITPAFGAKDNSELTNLYRNGIINYGPAFEDLETSLLRMVKQVKESSKTPLLSVMLEGASATGKSALAAKVCVESGFPLVRMVSPDSFIGKGLNPIVFCFYNLSIFVYVQECMMHRSVKLFSKHFLMLIDLLCQSSSLMILSAL
jgi:hypothetical protein